jgi:transposase
MAEAKACIRRRVLERGNTHRVMSSLLKRPFETNPVYAVHKRFVEEKTGKFPEKTPLSPA